MGGLVTKTCPECGHSVNVDLGASAYCTAHEKAVFMEIETDD